MTSSSERKLTVLTILVAVLLVAVAAQSVYMFALHGKLQTASNPPAADTIALPEDEAEEGALTNSPPLFSTRPFDPDPFEDDPFGWKLDDWDPFKEMHSMHDRINQMFGNAFNRFERSDDFGAFFDDYTFTPDINLEDKGDRYVVTVDLPGAEDSRLDVKIEGQTLTISGTIRSEARDEDEGRMLRQERRSGKFHRTVTLPSPVAADKMTTKNKKGVLYIEIPKATGED